MNDRCLLFFVRNPKGGTVKSRLASTVGKVVALDLYKNFIFDMLATLERQAFPLYCCFYPEDALADIKKIIGAQYQYLPQRGDDLGARMAHCFRQAFAQGFNRVALIGTLLIWLGMAWLAAKVTVRHCFRQVMQDPMPSGHEAQVERGDQSTEGGIS